MLVVLVVVELVVVVVDLQGVELLVALTLLPSRVHFRVLPSKVTESGLFGQVPACPGLKIVGWPRSWGFGVNLLLEPIAIVLSTLLGFVYVNSAM